MLDESLSGEELNMNKKQEEPKMNKIINRVWRGALVAAALYTATAYADVVDFSKIPDVRIFKGDETIGYRDPAAWYEDGVFHLFITVCDPSVPRMTIGHSTSRNLVDWSPVASADGYFDAIVPFSTLLNCSCA